MKRTLLNRRTPLVRQSLRRKEKERVNSHLVRRRRAELNRIGKKGKANKKANATLAKEFKGSHYCEARLQGCWGNVALSWSHHSKRRKLSTEELSEAALMCIPCHEQWEHLPPDELKANVKGLTAKRETELPEAA